MNSSQLSSVLKTAPISVQVGVVGALLALIYSLWNLLTPKRPYKDFPLVKVEEPSLSFQTIRKGLSDHGGRPFQVIGASGPRIVLPNRYADEIKSHPSLSLAQALVHDYDHDFPGFEALKAARTTGMKDFDFLVEVITKMTQALGVVTPDLVDETTRAFHDIFGDDRAWHSMTVKQNVLELIARQSSRLFLGDKLCRDENWLKLARDHSVEVMTAGHMLTHMNPLLRPIKQWYLEQCVRLRKARDEAYDLIQPEVDRLMAKAWNGEKDSRAALKSNSVGWMFETARDKKDQVDYSGNQLMLMMVSIHTTTEQMSQALVNLIANPHLVQPMRDEVAAVIRAEGWSKTSLHNMKLLDAFLRESSRLNPLSHVSMNRRVVSPMTLSTGEILPVGAIVMAADNYADAKIFTNPQKFDPYRWVADREVNPHSNYHVSLSPSVMGFGYGSHACPGRFIASNMMKVALAFMLINYDFRVEGGGASTETKKLLTEMETKILVMPDAQVEVRARSKEEREVEVDLLLP